MPLTSEGQVQARAAGEKLRALLRTDDTLHFFISPYARTRQTTEGILETLCSDDPFPSPFKRSKIKVYEEPRLREQDFGNFQPGTEEVQRLWRERANYGHFFYRIPNGESGADCFDRVSSFNDSLWRRFGESDMASVAILVTHGLMARVFLMKWYHFSVEYFEDLRNINHVEFLVMRLNPETGRYILQNQLRTWSDLKRERASRGSLSGGSFAAGVAQIPIRRRWGECPEDCSDPNHQHTAPALKTRPRRQNTADLFKDDLELLAAAASQPPSLALASSNSDTALPSEQPPVDTHNASKLAEKNKPLGQVASDGQQDGPLETVTDTRALFFRGRDNGGSRSGAPSPLIESDDDSKQTPRALAASPAPTQSATSVQTGVPPRSLARALRGDFDNPNRAMADALGDQSDAEVEEVDKAMGDEHREREEMGKILAEEVRQRGTSMQMQPL